ncbi:hypothetical protein GJAV_G00262500 [Gymnothorax javanicus]|nr:hypothetical protein GJAV_G00262500 [Gymnothorax javanicus]
MRVCSQCYTVDTVLRFWQRDRSSLFLHHTPAASAATPPDILVTIWLPRKKYIVQNRLIMPTSPVKTRIPLTSFGHLITEAKRQLFGIEPPSTGQFTGWRKHFNSYTLQGRRNFVLATYGLIGLLTAVYLLKKSDKEENRES